MAIGIDPTVDFAFQKMLGSQAYADITVHFLNAVLGDSVGITAVQILNPVSGRESADDKFSAMCPS